MPKVSDERLIMAVKQAKANWMPTGSVAQDLGMSKSRLYERISRLRKAGKL